MPAVIGCTYGGVVFDNESCKGLFGTALGAMADPKHIPIIAIRRMRLRGGRSVENMSSPKGEAGKLGFYIDVPIGVVFNNQAG